MEPQIKPLTNWCQSFITISQRIAFICKILWHVIPNFVISTTSEIPIVAFWCYWFSCVPALLLVNCMVEQFLKSAIRCCIHSADVFYVECFVCKQRFDCSIVRRVSVDFNVSPLYVEMLALSISAFSTVLCMYFCCLSNFSMQGMSIKLLFFHVSPKIELFIIK
jgi:hypothetical protein